MANKKRVPDIRFKGFDEEWEEDSLGNILNIRTERGNQQNFNFDIELENLVSDSGIIIGDISIRTESNSLFRIGDTLFGRLRPYLNKWWLADREGVKSGEIWALYPSDNINELFAYTVVQTKTFLDESYISSGTKMPRSDWTKISETKCLIPLFPEQTKIGLFLKTLDDFINLQQRKYDKTIKIKKACLEKMFPKKGQNSPEIRFDGFTDEWKERKLGEIALSFEYGLNAAAKKYDGINKYLRITDIDDSTHLFSQSVLTSPDKDLKTADNYLLKKGDILFARTGASVGKTYRYQNKDGKVYYAGFLVRTRIKLGYDSEFIFQNTLTSKYDKFIRLTSQRSGQPGVNAQEYSEYELFMPESGEQAAIGSFFNKLDKLIALYSQELEKLKNIKKALLEKMFV